MVQVRSAAQYTPGREGGEQVSGSSLQAPDFVGALLRHKDVSTTLRYAHLANDTARQAADEVAGVVVVAMGMSVARQTRLDEDRPAPASSVQRSLEIAGVGQLKTFGECLISANSSLAAVGHPNDWTEATMPDAEMDHRSRLGPKLPLEFFPTC